MPKVPSSRKFDELASASRRTLASSAGGAASSHTSTSTPLFNKNLGQHILHNPLVAQGIVDKANLRPTDVVLEVGPGTGNLTVRILEKAKKVTAVEMDNRLAAELLKRVQGRPEGRRLEIIAGDFLKETLPYFDVCISNTPYQISSPLVFKLLMHRPLCRVAILMFQREFAMRMVAKPGDNLWCRLSVNVQMYAKVDHIMKVGKGNFRPPPMVESSVIRMVPLDPPPPIAFTEWDGLMRIIFSRRNKTIRANFLGSRDVVPMLESNYKTFKAAREGITGMSDGATSDDLFSGYPDMKTWVDALIEATGFAENRAAKMSITEMMKLLLAFNEVGIHFAA